MTLEQMITYMTPRQGRNIGWVWLKRALTYLDSKTTTVDDKTKSGVAEMTSLNGFSVDVEFDDPYDDDNYVFASREAVTAEGRIIFINITNKTKDGFTVSATKYCTFEYLTHKY
jgi:hypothetical protein